MQNEYENEPVVTLKDVLKFVAGTVLLLCFMVAIIAVIWENLYALRVALTIMISVFAICCFCWWFDDQIKKLRK